MMYAMLADENGRCMHFVEVDSDGILYMLRAATPVARIGTLIIAIDGKGRREFPIVQMEQQATRPADSG